MLKATIKEDLIHFVWKMKLFNLQDLRTTDGRAIEITNWGNHNNNSGPDFSEGKIKIENTLWAGNIEMHVFSSDWHAHNHSNDSAYDNVILHVVYEQDKEVFSKNGNSLPTLELKTRLSDDIIFKYSQLINNSGWIPCSNLINNESWSSFDIWKYKLLTERIKRKTEIYHTHLHKNSFDWDSTFYWGLMRYFGAKINILPFEMLAESIPLSTIIKNLNSLIAVESLLFGQAGMLASENNDIYYSALKSEYEYQAKKYNLISINVVAWKFARLRPAGFPTVRIAQIAALLSKEPRLFSKIIELENMSEIYKLMEVDPSSYWDNHYIFNEDSTFKKKPVTKNFIDLLIINVAVPLLFLYGKQTGNNQYCDKAFDLLEMIKAEKNNVISKWVDHGAKIKSAADSQSLLELKNEYCNNQKCLSCNIGSKMIKG